MKTSDAIVRSLRPEAVDAVLLLKPGSPSQLTTIAGVTVQERALRILLRSKFSSVTVVTSEPPKKWQSRVRKGVIRVQQEWVPNQKPTLFISAEMAFERSFPEKLIKHPPSEATLFCTPEGEVAAVFSPDTEPHPGPARDFADSVRQLSQSGAETRQLEPDWICHRVESKEEARRFHRRIERTLIKSTDDMFARWNRRVSLPLSRVLAELPITPNQVTYATLIVALIGAYFFSRGGYWDMLLGAILTQLSSILDGNDGELARLKIEDSDFGTWLDTVCDYISYFLTFGSIGWGLYTRHQDPYYLILTGLVFLGSGITMLLLSYFRKVKSREGEASSFKSKAKAMLAREEKRNFWSYLSARLNHFATRATISYFLIIFAILDSWPLLLYFAVTGAHVFWIMILYHSWWLKSDE